MAYIPLTLCPHCARHIRSNESQCPFCRASLSDSLAQSVEAVPSSRLSRAALMVFSASLAMQACDKSDTSTPPAPMTTPDPASTTVTQGAALPAPPTPPATAVATPDATSPQPTVAVADPTIDMGSAKPPPPVMMRYGIRPRPPVVTPPTPPQPPNPPPAPPSGARRYGMPPRNPRPNPQPPPPSHANRYGMMVPDKMDPIELKKSPS